MYGELQSYDTYAVPLAKSDVGFAGTREVHVIFSTFSILYLGMQSCPRSSGRDRVHLHRSEEGRLQTSPSRKRLRDVRVWQIHRLLLPWARQYYNSLG